MIGIAARSTILSSFNDEKKDSNKSKVLNSGGSFGKILKKGVKARKNALDPLDVFINPLKPHALGARALKSRHFHAP
jgi:hypothetical protein